MYIDNKNEKRTYCTNSVCSSSHTLAPNVLRSSFNKVAAPNQQGNICFCSDSSLPHIYSIHRTSTRISLCCHQLPLTPSFHSVAYLSWVKPPIPCRYTLSLFKAKRSTPSFYFFLFLSLSFSWIVKERSAKPPAPRPPPL